MTILLICRTYLIENGLKDTGIMPTKDDLENYKRGNISKKLRSDWTHLNCMGYYSKGKGIYLKGVELGYWSDTCIFYKLSIIIN